MKQYIVVCWQPLSDDNRVTHIEANTFFEAKKIANEKRKCFYDVVIISKQKVTNRLTNNQEEIYTIEKFGYYRIYRLVNLILSLLIVSLVIFIAYLYFNFVNLKK